MLGNNLSFSTIKKDRNCVKQVCLKSIEEIYGKSFKGKNMLNPFLHVALKYIKS